MVMMFALVSVSLMLSWLRCGVDVADAYGVVGVDIAVVVVVGAVVFCWCRC